MTLTTLWVCVCPTRINIFEQIIDKQKLSRMMDRSDRIYLKKKKNDKSNQISLQLDEITCHHVVAACALKVLQLPP